MRPRVAPWLSLLLCAAGVACGSFSGSDNPAPDPDPLVDGGAPSDASVTDGARSSDASRALDAAAADATPPPPAPVFDAGALPVMGAYASPACAGVVTSMFCEDFESRRTPPFAFKKVESTGFGAMDVVSLADNSHVLRVVLPTAGTTAAPAGIDLTTVLASPPDGQEYTLDFDILIASTSLSYATFGGLQFISGASNDELGVGSYPGQLGEARSPGGGPATVMSTGKWQHVYVLVSPGSYLWTEVDSTIVQMMDISLLQPNPTLALGIFECGPPQSFLMTGGTTIYLDNIIVQAQ